MFGIPRSLPIALLTLSSTLTSCMVAGPRGAVSAAPVLGAAAASPATAVTSQSEALAEQREPMALSIGGGRAYLSSDLSPGDELDTFGVELSSSAAFGSVGWEVGFATASDDFTEDNGPITDYDFDYSEIYAGLRKGFSYGPVELHLGLGVSYVDLEVDSETSIATDARGLPSGASSVDDSSLGGYVQVGAFAPLADWVGIGISGRHREGEDFESNGQSADGSASTLSVHLVLFR